MSRLINALALALLAFLIFTIIVTIAGTIALTINVVNNTYLHWSVANLLASIVVATFFWLATIYYRMNK